MRSNEQKTNKLGDRALEVHYVYGGGVQNTALSLHTYSVEGNDSKGRDAIVKAAKYGDNIWSYVYFGFDALQRSAYGVLLKPG